MKKNLLIDEYPLMVQPSLAVRIGLDDAIVLQRLHFWLCQEKVGYMINGEKWIKNDYEAWQQNFPWWSVVTIKRIFIRLSHKNLVLSCQPDAYDRTKYYRINYDNVDAIVSN